MPLTVMVHTDTAAFLGTEQLDTVEYPDGFTPGPTCRKEAARILRQVADRLESDEHVDHYLTVRDANGEDVGRFRLLTDRS